MVLLAFTWQSGHFFKLWHTATNELSGQIQIQATYVLCKPLTTAQEQ